jgi:hypothetical protein
MSEPGAIRINPGSTSAAQLASPARSGSNFCIALRLPIDCHQQEVRRG